MINNFYVLIKEHSISGWRIDDTIWNTLQDACDAAVHIGKENPAFTILIGYENEEGLLVIPNSISDIPTFPFHGQ